MIVTTSSANPSVLHAGTVPVFSGDEAIATIIALEKELMFAKGVGLAAPQIGISKSVAIIRHHGVSINLINPSIISVSREFINPVEGCLSLPDRQFSVKRFGTVRIKNHILWPSPSVLVPLNSDPNKQAIDHNSPPKGLYLVPVEQVYVVENCIEDQGDIICMAVQHEEEHLRGITLDKKEGVVENYALLTGDQKVGRNDPCPCGSGKKYKKCCMQK